MIISLFHPSIREYKKSSPEPHPFCFISQSLLAYDDSLSPYPRFYIVEYTAQCPLLLTVSQEDDVCSYSFGQNIN